MDLITSGWADAGFNPGDTFEFQMPMLPSWAKYVPRSLMRFVPLVKTTFRGVVPPEGVRSADLTRQ